MPRDLAAVPAEALPEGEAPREVLAEECGLSFSAQGGLGRVGGGQIWEPELKASYTVKWSTPHATPQPPPRNGEKKILILKIGSLKLQ